MKILVCNVGSTSLKYKLFEMDGETVLCRGQIDGVGGTATVDHVAGARRVAEREAIADQQAAVRRMIGLLSEDPVLELGTIAAIGFKVVGGEGVGGVVELDDRVVAAMEAHTPLLPRHNPPYIAAIRIFRQQVPDIPLVGLFETAFHADMPAVAYTYGVPEEWRDRYGVRRYGYHGASFTFIAERVPAILGRPAAELRYVACHLGGSSSVCAIRAGKSVDTSMGMSNQAGVSMSNRCGDLDPFVIPYIMDRAKLSTEDVRSVLTRDGGLAGISGMGGDVRRLEAAAAEGNSRARLALEVFAYEVKKYIGAYAAALGAIDALVFTGGIGEKGSAMRGRICSGLEFLGIRLDPDRNAVCGTEAVVSTQDAPTPVLVVPTNEEIIVARKTKEFLANRVICRST